MLHAQGVQAADELEDVQKHLRQLQQKEEQIRRQLSDRSLQAVSDINRSGFADDAPAQRPLPDLLQEATVLDTGAKYLERLEASPACGQCCRRHALESETAACSAYHKQVYVSQLQLHATSVVEQVKTDTSGTFCNPYVRVAFCV